MWPSAAIAVVVLAALAPYVARIRHPRQQPFAAYLVFVTVFSVAAVVLFVVLAWAGRAFGVLDDLGRAGIVAALVLLGLVPAFALATWQARKPPANRPPPD